MEELRCDFFYANFVDCHRYKIVSLQQNVLM